MEEIVKKSIEVIIKSPEGLHLRPASEFVQCACQYESTIHIEKDGQLVDGKSMMNLMMLAAVQGTNLVLHAEGHDSQNALDALSSLF